VERFVIHFHFIYCLLSLLNPELFFNLDVVILLLFISIYIECEAIIGELKPLIESHIPIVNSINMFGSKKINPIGIFRFKNFLK